jgi:hypothetical protein
MPDQKGDTGVDEETIPDTSLHARLRNRGARHDPLGPQPRSAGTARREPRHARERREERAQHVSVARSRGLTHPVSG